MEITEIKVFAVDEEKLKAFVSIVLDGCFMVNDIKLIQGKDGLFISMPSRRKKNGRFKDIAHPLNNETRQMMEERIVAEYRQVVGGEVAGPRPIEPSRPAQPAASAAEPVHRRTAVSAPPPAETAAGGGASGGGVDEPAEVPAEAAEQAPAPEPEPAADDKSLEEIAEAHLKDSYWTT